MSAEWVEDVRKLWKEDSVLFQNEVLGEFSANQSNGVIPLSWIEAANDRWRAWDAQGRPGTLTSIGVDVGGGQPKADSSVIAPIMDGGRVYEVRIVGVGNPSESTMELAGIVHGLLDKHGTGIAIVDNIGIGLGVLQRLHEQNDRVYGFGAGSKTLLRDMTGERGFLNWRAAMWWTGREILDPDNKQFSICLPPDDRLTGELTAPTSSTVSNGLIKIEDKASVIRRIGRSTDCADAVLMGLVGPTLLDEFVRNNQQPGISYNPVQIGNY
jgi:hypothetical protein